MLFALVHPVALAGLLPAFLLAMVLRGVAQRAVLARVSGLRGRPQTWDPRHDFDVFGVVAALLGGTGWGRRATPAGFQSRSRIAVLLAGPAAVLLASQLAFGATLLVGGLPQTITLLSMWEILAGHLVGDPLAVILASFAVGLLAAGLVALIPLPPLDGWGVLAARAGNRPSHGFARAQHWLDEQNIGIVILLIGLVIPIGAGQQPVLFFLLDLIVHPVLLLWSFA